MDISTIEAAPSIIQRRWRIAHFKRVWARPLVRRTVLALVPAVVATVAKVAVDRAVRTRLAPAATIPSGRVIHAPTPAASGADGDDVGPSVDRRRPESQDTLVDLPVAGPFDVATPSESSAAHVAVAR